MGKLKLKKRIDIPCGQTYLMHTDDGHFLEAGDVCMSREPAYGTRPYRFQDFDAPADTNKRVMTICTMAGCPMGCGFCASRRSYKRKLTQEEIVGQVKFMVENGIPLGRNADLNNAKELRILYTRMGEPMLNADNVIGSIKEFISLYPHVIIGMSTSGIKKGVKKFLDHPEILSHIDMQFSLHSTDDSERRKLFEVNVGPGIMSIPQIAEMIQEWFKISKQKISLNMILLKDYTYNIRSLLDYFDPNQIWLRLSPWNEVEDAKIEKGYVDLLKTEDVLHKEPLSSPELKRIIDEIKDCGISYAYAPAIDEEIKYQVACGQALEAFKKEVREEQLQKTWKALEPIAV